MNDLKEMAHAIACRALGAAGPKTMTVLSLSDAIAEYGRVVQDRAIAAQPAPLSAGERAEVRRVLEPFARIVGNLPRARSASPHIRAAADLYQRLGEAGEPTDADMFRALIEHGWTVASAFIEGKRWSCCWGDTRVLGSGATPREAITAAMKRGDA